MLKLKLKLSLVRAAVSIRSEQCNMSKGSSCDDVNTGTEKSKKRPKRMPNLALLSFLVPLSASCFRLGMLMMSYPSMPDTSTFHSTDVERQLGETPNRNSNRRKAFRHGVASGDPTADAVIIWTRVTTDTNKNDKDASVTWKMSQQRNFKVLQASGSATTNADRDYTLKIDATGLDPYTVYFYQFTYCFAPSDCEVSAKGRTKTAPARKTQVKQLRFASVSCSSYQQGYFHAYDRITDKDDVDAVIHLGDYIYENAAGVFGDIRVHDPPTETVSLQDYRLRYAQYRKDQSLKRLHQNFPFITIWDDHEFVDNAWSQGGELHDPATEGAWKDRKKAAAQAYIEWMPIRVARKTPRKLGEEPMDKSLNSLDFSLYRKFSFGKLVDIFALDARIAGRDEQRGFDGGQAQFLPSYYDSENKLLGDEQMAWLKKGLSSSKAKWKVLAQQVVFAPISLKGVASHNADAWDGYQAARANLTGYIIEKDIDNVVILTGDVHSTLISDIPKEKTADLVTYGDWLRRWPWQWKWWKSYTSIAIEFAVSAVTSTSILAEDYNLDEVPYGLEIADFMFKTVGPWMNPHGK